MRGANTARYYKMSEGTAKKLSVNSFNTLLFSEMQAQ